MDRRSTSIVMAATISLLALLGRGGFDPSHGSGPRALSPQEKHALHGGQYQNRCCFGIASCFSLPNYDSCGDMGTLRCQRQLAKEYDYNGNNMSCGGTSNGTTCNLGDAAPCVTVTNCAWSYARGKCVTSGAPQPYEPGYASCSPDCTGGGGT